MISLWLSAILSKRRTVSLLFISSAVLIPMGVITSAYSLVFEKHGIEAEAKVTHTKSIHSRLGDRYHFFYEYIDSAGCRHNGDGYSEMEAQEKIHSDGTLKIRYLKESPNHSTIMQNRSKFGLKILLFGIAVQAVGLAALWHYKMPNGKYDI